jgi:hypothetical protein
MWLPRKHKTKLPSVYPWWGDSRGIFYLTRQVIIVLDDEVSSTSEHYLDLLAEELSELLARRNLKLVNIEELETKKGPNSR